MQDTVGSPRRSVACPTAPPTSSSLLRPETARRFTCTNRSVTERASMLRMEREQIENSFSERRSRSWDPAVSVVILLPVRNLLQHAAKLENLAGEHDISSLVDVDEVLGPQVRRRAGQILVCAVVFFFPSVQNRPFISGRR